LGLDTPHLIKHIIKIESFVCEIISLPKFAEIGFDYNKHITSNTFTTTKLPQEPFMAIGYSGGEIIKGLSLNMCEGVCARCKRVVPEIQLHALGVSKLQRFVFPRIDANICIIIILKKFIAQFLLVRWLHP